MLRSILKMTLLAVLAFSSCIGLAACEEDFPTDPVEIPSEPKSNENTVEPSSADPEDPRAPTGTQEGKGAEDYSDPYTDDSAVSYTSGNEDHDFFVEPWRLCADDEYCTIYLKGIGHHPNGWLCVTTEVTNNYHDTIHFFPEEPWSLDRAVYEPYGCDGGLGTIEPGETKECCISFNPDDNPPGEELWLLQGLTYVYNPRTSEYLGEYWIDHIISENGKEVLSEP